MQQRQFIRITQMLIRGNRRDNRRSLHQRFTITSVKLCELTDLTRGFRPRPSSSTCRKKTGDSIKYDEH